MAYKRAGHSFRLRHTQMKRDRSVPHTSRQRALVIVALVLVSLSFFLTSAPLGQEHLAGQAIRSVVFEDGLKEVTLCDTKRPLDLVRGGISKLHTVQPSLVRGTTTVVLDSSLCVEQSSLFSLLKYCATNPRRSFDSEARMKFFCGGQGKCAYARSMEGEDKGNTYCAYVIYPK